MSRTYTSSMVTALVAVAALALSGTGWAEGTESGMSEMSGNPALSQQQEKAFLKLDTNKDGKISQEEAKQSPTLSDQFSQTDSNRDNVIDEGEFARFEMENNQD